MIKIENIESVEVGNKKTVFVPRFFMVLIPKMLENKVLTNKGKVITF